MYESFFKYLLDRKDGYITKVCEENKSRYRVILTYLLKLSDALAEQEKKKPSKEVAQNIAELKKQIDKLEGEKQLLAENGLSHNGYMIKMQQMYDDLLSNPKIKSVAIFENRRMIVVHTNPILVTIKSEKLNIGQYTITLDFNTNTMGMRRSDKSVVRIHGGRNVLHPFITPTSICFGSHSELVEEAFEQGGFYSLIMFAIALLECKSGVDGGYCSWISFATAIKKGNILLPTDAQYSGGEE